MTRVALESRVVPEARYLIRKSGSSGFESSGIMTHVQTLEPAGTSKHNLTALLASTNIG